MTMRRVKAALGLVDRPSAEGLEHAVHGVEKTRCNTADVCVCVCVRVFI